MGQVRLEELEQQETELLSKLEKTEEDIRYIESAIGQFFSQNPYAEKQLPGDLVKVMNYKKATKKSLLVQLQKLRDEMSNQ